MGFDLNKCYSHPGKLLKVHLENVALLSKRITGSDAAGLVSLFHDIYNPQNEMLPFHKTKCSETQNEASSL